MDKLKVSTGAIVRVVLLVLAIINSFLSAFGVIPEEIVGNDQAYVIASQIITALVAAWNSWKNNSFTQNAIKADKYLACLKSCGVGRDEENSTVITAESSNNKE